MNEKIKKYADIALIVLLLSGSFGIVRYATSYANSVQPVGRFSVSGEGKIVGIPDSAQFSYGVLVEGGKDIGALQSENSKKGNMIIDFLKSQGIGAKDIQTQSYSIFPRYQKNGDIIGYSVSQTVSAKIRDFSKISSILSGIVQKGANSVSQISFTIDDPATLQAKAKDQAMKDAKDKAIALAKSGGFGIGRLLSVSEGGSFPRPMYALSENAKGGGPTIEPGSQEISATVTLEYEIR